MAFWSKKRDVEERSETTSGLAIPEQWMFDLLGNGLTAPSGERVTVQKALTLVPVWAAVRIISEQIAMLPLKVYREIDGEKTEAVDTPRWRLLHDMPNANTPAGRFWATVSVHLLLWGNAFIKKNRTNDVVVDELFLLRPADVTVLWNPVTGEKKFRYVPQIAGITPETFDESEVLHIFGMSLDGVVGESVISHCAASIGAALARDRYEGAFYNRGATLSGVLQADGVVSDQARKNIVGSFASGFGGARGTKAGGTPLLEEGIEFKPISSPMRDMEFVAAQQLTRTDIAVMFQLPPNALGGSSGDSLTYSTVELEQQHIALHAVAPITTTIEQFVTHDPGILPQNIFSCAFTLDAMMRADSKTRAEVYALALGTDKAPGWMTNEEVRRRENLSPAKLPAKPATPAVVGEDVRLTEPAPASVANGAPKIPAAATAVNGNGSGG